MKRIFNIILGVTILLAGVYCSPKNTTDTRGDYKNPILRVNCPDPSVIDNRKQDGYFYLYSTQRSDNNGNTLYIPIYRSKNLINWELVGSAFTEEGHPQWVENARLWAPDINYINGKYVLYYAMGVWGDLERSCSGVAVADSPTGPFTDKGMIVDFKTTGVRNGIDPNYFEAKKHKYLYWGSLGNGSGIHGVELSSDGLSVAKGSEITKLTCGKDEGAYMHKRGKYYYLFASRGSCCEGARSTYNVIVGRSKDPMGPFVSKTGKSMLDEDYDLTILSGTEDKLFVGTGHNAEIITDDAGDDWMIYHTYWKENNYKGRVLAIDKVLWDNEGWPYFETGHPTTSHIAPYFK